MRVPISEIKEGRWFLWHGVAYKKTENVPWGTIAYDINFKRTWIGATALVESNAKDIWPRRKHKEGRA